MVEGIYSLTRKTPRVGCGAGIQWVKNRPSSAVLQTKLIDARGLQHALRFTSQGISRGL